MLTFNNASRNFHVLTIPDQMCGQIRPKWPLSEKQMIPLDSVVNLVQNNRSDLHDSLLLHIFPFSTISVKWDQNDHFRKTNKKVVFDFTDKFIKTLSPSWVFKQVSYLDTLFWSVSDDLS